MAATIFEAQGVTKVYRTGDVEVWALRGVDMTLSEGEMAVLLGPSGSGKSTLLNIIGGLDRASGGIVRFRGEDLTSYSERRLTRYRREHVGFVFQFYNLVPSLTALENVALITEISRRPMRPEVLLCDEPTGALDSRTGILVLEALSRINRELGTTTAIITHTAAIRKIAHRVFFFKDGRIAETIVNSERLQPAEVDW